MGLFDQLKKKIVQNQAERQQRLEEQIEEDKALAKARHEARLKYAVQIAEAEEAQRLKEITEGRTDKQENGIWGKLVEMGQNVNRNMDSGNMSLGGNMGAGFEFNNPFEPASQRKHKPNNKNHKKHNKSSGGKVIHIHIPKTGVIIW